jgi:hypothetical protein
MRPRKPFACLSGLALLVLAGCGGGNVRVTGQLVEDGRPFPLPPGEAVAVHIHTADPAVYPPRAYLKFVKPDGSFAAGPNDGSGKGLPPGKYKIFGAQRDAGGG